MRGLGIPAAPAHAGEASLVGRKRPPGLPLVGGDDVLRLSDFLLEFGNRLLRLAGAARLRWHAYHEPRGFDVLQGLAKLLELGAVPCNGAVTVYRHAEPPDSWSNLARMGQAGPRARYRRAAPAHWFCAVRPGPSRFRPFFAIEATAGEPSNNKLAWRSVHSAVPYPYRPGGRMPAWRNGACDERS